MTWASAKQPPETDRHVLCFSIKYGVHMCFYDAKNKLFINMTDLKPLPKVTYWSEITLPPK